MAKILVVDDEECIRSLICLILEHYGHFVMGVSSPTEAIENFDESFDLVTTDFRMPCMNGLKLIEILREKKPRIKVAFISGSPEICENVNYLPKPFSLGEFQQFIERLLNDKDSE